MSRVEQFQSMAGGRRIRGTFDFAVIDDHARLPWRFLARRKTLDGLSVSF